MSERTDTSDAATRAESEARGAELREELATTDLRRAEEEEAKAEQAIEDAREKESKKERKRREAEERRVAAAAEADAARKQAEAAKAAAQPVQERPSVSGASVTSPGLGASTDPKAAAAANAPRLPGAAPDPVEKPELYVAGAFAGGFLLAKILRRIAE